MGNSVSIGGRSGSVQSRMSALDEVTMICYLSKALDRLAKGWLVLIFMAMGLLFMVVIMPWTGARLQSFSGGAGLLDSQFFFTPDRAYQMMLSYGDSGRAFYRAIELTLDIVYPIIYVIFLGLFIAWPYKRAFPAGSPMQRLNVVPFGAWLFDLLEKLGIVTLLSVFPKRLDGLAWATTVFTMMKWVFVLACVLLVLIGLMGIWRARSAHS